MKRYHLTKRQQGGLGAGRRETSVVEIANAATPPEGQEAYRVADDAPLHDWRYSPPEEELPAPVDAATPGGSEE